MLNVRHTRTRIAYNTIYESENRLIDLCTFYVIIIIADVIVYSRIDRTIKMQIRFLPLM